MLNACILAAAATAIGLTVGWVRAGVAAGLATPTESSPPTISGTAQDNQTLHADPGNWNGTAPITYAYQWTRCDEHGGGCSEVNGATSQAYGVSSHDVGHTLRVRVTAKNADGSATDTSVPTAVVTSAPSKPSESSPPTISGTAQDNQTLTAAPGSWNGTAPIDYSYRWRRCDAKGGGCGDIDGAGSSTYRVTSRDVGHTLRVTVTAKNGAGSASDSSAPTAVVTAAAPPPPVNGCPSGSAAVNVSQLAPPARLTVDAFQSSPSTLGRTPGDVTVRFHVTACKGRPVAGALVYATAVPYAQFSVPPEAQTGSDGWVTEVMHQAAHYPASSRQELLAVFVRARKSGEDPLGGISTRRLVSFRVDLHR